jgi:hypothetical protein
MKNSARKYAGRFWIDPDGTVHRLHDSCSHEEWANTIVGTSLEALFGEGWVRLQGFPGRYLLVDHGQQTLNPAQAEALWHFFFGPDGMIPYSRMVIDRHGHESREFPAGQNQAAYTFACTGKVGRSILENGG